MGGYVIDIAVICFLGLFIALGIRRGFIRSAARFLGTAISAFLASALGGAVAQWAFDALFRDALVERIEEVINTSGGDSLALGAQNVFASLPDFIQRALTAGGVTIERITQELDQKTTAAAGMIADYLAPVFVGFLKVLAVLVLFLLFVMLVRGLSDMLAAAFRLPILKQMDMLLGGIFGLLLAVFSLWVIVAAVGVFTPMLSQEVQGDLENTLSKTVIAGHLVGRDPLQGMFR